VVWRWRSNGKAISYLLHNVSEPVGGQTVRKQADVGQQGPWGRGDGQSEKLAV
jgi:hypothetical protein